MLSLATLLSLILHGVLCSLSFLIVVSQSVCHWFYLFSYTLSLFLPSQIHPLVIPPNRRWVRVRFWTLSWTQFTQKTKKKGSKFPFELNTSSSDRRIRTLSAFITLAKSHGCLLERCHFCNASMSYMQRCESVLLMILDISASSFPWLCLHAGIFTSPNEFIPVVNWAAWRQQ